MNKIKNFMTTAGVYFVGNVLSKLIGFFLLPLYTNYLSPDIFGEYDYIVTIMSFAAPICFFQIWDAMFRFSFDDSDSRFKTKVINNSYIVMVCGIIVYSIVFIPLNVFIKFKLPLYTYVYGLSVACNYHYSYLARVFQKNILFSISGFWNSLFVAVCNIVLILVFEMGLESLYIASILGAVIQCIIIEARLKTSLKFNLKDYDQELVRLMVKFSFPLCIATISYWLLSGFTKMIIVNQLGVFENGLYAVTNKFAMFLNMAVSIFQFAWNEMVYIANKDADRKSMYTLAVEYIIQFVLIAACGLILLSKMVFPYVIGEEYLDAVRYLPASVMGVALNAIAGFCGTIFSTEKQTQYILKTTIVAAIINCILGIGLTKMFGLQGSLVALAVAFGVLMVGRLIYLNKRLEIKLAPKSLVFIFCVVITIIMFYACNNIMVTGIYIVLLLLFVLIYNMKMVKYILGVWRKKI